MTKSAACTGVCPCEGCVEVVLGAVVLPSLLAAQADVEQSKAFIACYDAKIAELRAQVAAAHLAASRGEAPSPAATGARPSESSPAAAAATPADRRPEAPSVKNGTPARSGKMPSPSGGRTQPAADAPPNGAETKTE